MRLLLFYGSLSVLRNRISRKIFKFGYFRTFEPFLYFERAMLFMDYPYLT